MSNGAPDPLDFAKKLSESFREVKFGQGIVGKTSYSLLAVIGLWAIVLVRLSENWWLNLALFGAAVLATILYWRWLVSTQQFAKENPSLALLEGAQLLEYKKFEAEAKGYLGSPSGAALNIEPRMPL